ncbi:MAG: M28 family peptidase [Planctomycetota bacterium]
MPRTESTPGGKLHFINLYADLPAEKADAPLVLLGSHMDTKFLPDFQGVNDGGSSTAALLELAGARRQPTASGGLPLRVLRRRGGRARTLGRHGQSPMVRAFTRSR